MKKSATGLNIYASEKIGPKGLIYPHPVAIYMYFKHPRKCLANQSQILYEAFIGRGNQCVHENPGHLTKMATMSIYGKTPQLLFFCPVIVLADSHVSGRCPWATYTCLMSKIRFFDIKFFSIKKSIL